MVYTKPIARNHLARQFIKQQWLEWNCLMAMLLMLILPKQSLLSSRRVGLNLFYTPTLLKLFALLNMCAGEHFGLRGLLSSAHVAPPAPAPAPTAGAAAGDGELDSDPDSDVGHVDPQFQFQRMRRVSFRFRVQEREEEEEEEEAPCPSPQFFVTRRRL